MNVTSVLDQGGCGRGAAVGRGTGSSPSASPSCGTPWPCLLR